MTDHKAILVGHGLYADNIFNLQDRGNRDNSFAPYASLSESFLEQGIELHTSDMVDDEVLFELHMNVQPVARSRKHAYLMLLETPAIHPNNAIPPEYYRKIFTWNDLLVDNDCYIKFNFPNIISIPAIDGFEHRDRFCCLIAGNKIPAKHDQRELYSERVHAIRWFETNAPEDFDLYGIGWHMPAARSKLTEKIIRYFWLNFQPVIRKTGFIPFPSYRGEVMRKFDVLHRTRFSICYENMRDIPGYITEKLFDCFFAGCVPIYLGANNISDYVPSGCYINYKKFDDMAAIYTYVKEMDEETYCGYQKQIAVFLASDKAMQFSTERFVETIVTTIMQDINNRSVV